MKETIKLLEYTHAMLEHKKTWTTPSKRDKEICSILEAQQAKLIQQLNTQILCPK